MGLRLLVNDVFVVVSLDLTQVTVKTGKPMY